MSQSSQPGRGAGPSPSARRLDKACDRFEEAWLAGLRPCMEDYLGEVTGPERSELFHELLRLDLHYRRRQMETPTEQDYCQAFQEYTDLIHSVFCEEAALRERQSAGSSRPLGQETGPELAGAVPVEPPDHLGRYRIMATLGYGTFGVVYRAYDGELQRDVAIKVPHRKHVACPADIEAYLAEARILASLEHPHIVPVHDFGRTDDGLCYVVSKLIEGHTLAKKLEQGPPSAVESAELVTAIAEALHCAHRQGLVHRDIKPGNILLDASGKPYIADFGLALRQENIGQGPKFAGTPAYMSPEQARGEGHRVDGRSDIFSLGVVFYELLTGRRPFQADSCEVLLEQITSSEIRRPRQWDETIPKELERICLKALSKRVLERFTTAKDMADDLRDFLAVAPVEEKSARADRERHEEEVGTPLPRPVRTASDQQVGKIVPKGLRSFDATDADLFLELVPGPRDRDGLPDSIRFWKRRIETTDADNTFAVGLIYGPSGCGKSSLVKAGLLPRLAQSVTVVYIEATGEETEARLLKGLRRQLADLPGEWGLIESLAALRQGRYFQAGQKVLLVLDQFEQWLHANRREENTKLVRALRQCDGGRLQCVVLVRDDFWMAATRLMASLEISLLQGHNCAAVDLFDLFHARKVLAAFGRAYGQLPDDFEQGSKEQAAFLNQAVVGLAEDSKVISVRLALFAEMVKGKPWTPDTLKEIGGTQGVGVTFLEETFAASTAPPLHRLHQKAAQAALRALLPEAGTDIKGHMLSQEELLEASGYASHPRDFGDLLRILDSELRLVTPTDPEGKNRADPSMVQSGAKYYQLTHDYLVPSLREWLSRKQKETRRGRAELVLADQAAFWNTRPEKRQLPSLPQWLQIRLLTRKRSWTPLQQKMMHAAHRYHAARGAMVAAILVLLGLVGWEGYGRIKAHTLRDRLLVANTADVTAIIAEMAPYRRWLNPLLHEAYAQAKKENDPRKQLRAGLALLPEDAGPINYLYDRLLDAEPPEVAVIRDLLAPQRGELRNNLWAVVEEPDRGREHQRLRAAAALATYEPDSERWTTVQKVVADDLVAVPTVNLAAWLQLFRPVREQLLLPLAAVYRDKERRESERSVATDILADYAADQLQVLADLLMDADEKQFAVLYSKFEEHGTGGLAVPIEEIDRKLPATATQDTRQKLARRQANAAVALLRMNHEERIWPLLKHSRDPTTRSYLIHRLAPLGADAHVLLERLNQEPDVTIRRALILSLGEYGETTWSSAERAAVIAQMQEIYRSADDPGLHAAAEWWLRQSPWKQEEWLHHNNEAWAKDRRLRDTRLQAIRQVWTKRTDERELQWYVTEQGQTMIVIAGPVEFRMGSPPEEEGHTNWEPQHRRRIDRNFALASTSVTVAQFQRFLKINPLRQKQFEADGATEHMNMYAPKPDCPIITVDWFMAAAYCNWLSEREGIPQDQWCYTTDSIGQLIKKAGYWNLAGYRLPTEAEWEYACRARATTSRYYGESEELLKHYAWFLLNSRNRTWPVGTRKPNDFGFFDMHANTRCWCQESMKRYPQGGTDRVFDDVDDFRVLEDSRAMRGSAYYNDKLRVRSAPREGHEPGTRWTHLGFRPARTFR